MVNKISENQQLDRITKLIIDIENKEINNLEEIIDVLNIIDSYNLKSEKSILSQFNHDTRGSISLLDGFFSALFNNDKKTKSELIFKKLSWFKWVNNAEEIKKLLSGFLIYHIKKCFLNFLLLLGEKEWMEIRKTSVDLNPFISKIKKYIDSRICIEHMFYSDIWKMSKYKDSNFIRINNNIPKWVQVLSNPNLLHVIIYNIVKNTVYLKNIMNIRLENNIEKDRIKLEQARFLDSTKDIERIEIDIDLIEESDYQYIIIRDNLNGWLDLNWLKDNLKLLIKKDPNLNFVDEIDIEDQEKKDLRSWGKWNYALFSNTLKILPKLVFLDRMTTRTSWSWIWLYSAKTLSEKLNTKLMVFEQAQWWVAFCIWIPRKINSDILNTQEMEDRITEILHKKVV